MEENITLVMGRRNEIRLTILTNSRNGTMLKSVYDPNNHHSDAFARANHTGQQPSTTISDFEAASEEVIADSASVVHTTGDEEIDGEKTANDTWRFLDMVWRTISDPNVIDQTALMTSNTSPRHLCYASTEANSSNAAWNAFDKNTSSKWTASATTGVLAYWFAYNLTITSYAITGPIGGQASMGPKTWTFEGSNDGVTWDVLDTRSNQASWGSSEKRNYTLTNLTAYRTYRLNITANQGHGTNLSLTELNMYSEPMKAMSDGRGSAHFTNLTAETFYDKGSREFNVKAFGATGNGVKIDLKAFQAAHDQMPAEGGKIAVPAGVYMFDDLLNIWKTNVEFELDEGAIIRAAPGAANLSLRTGQPGLIHIYHSTGTQDHVYIHGGTIDCNNVAELNPFSVWGAGSDTSIWTTELILIENTRIINKGNSNLTFGAFNILTGGCSNSGNFGRVRKVTLRNVDIDQCDRTAVNWFGDYLEDFTIDGGTMSNLQRHSIAQNNYLGIRTTRRFRVMNVKFMFTGLRQEDDQKTIGDFSDESRTGGHDFYWINNHAEGDIATVKDHSYRMMLNTHRWERMIIEGNEAIGLGQFISFGESLAGTNWRYAGCEPVMLTNNIISHCINAFDDDSSYQMKINHNHFEYIGFQVFSAYGQHYNTEFKHNTMYNCNAMIEDSEYLAFLGLTLADLGEYSKALIQIGGNNKLFIQDNKGTDDRLLEDPGVVTNTASQVVGGGLGARTYYIKTTFSNDSGETLPSTNEVSIAVLANKLAKINLGPPQSLLDGTFHSASGIRYLNIYVGTSPGGETLQASVAFPTMDLDWTEPTTGLVTGAALPVANTTHHMTKYGLVSLSGGDAYASGLNNYARNEFYGIATPYAFSEDNLSDPSPSYDNFLDGQPLPRNVALRLGSETEMTVNLPSPAKPTASASTSGGTLASADHYYTVSAVDSSGGETLSSIERKSVVTGPTGSVSLSWPAIPRAASYKVYRSAGLDQSHRQNKYFTVSALRTNLITNPSVEVDRTGWDGLTNGQPGSSIAASATQAKYGSQSTKIINAGSSSDDCFTGITVSGLQANTDYTFSAYLYLETYSAAPFSTRAIFGFAAGPTNITSTPIGSTTTGQWVRYSITLNTGAGTSLSFRLYAPVGTSYWDAALLEVGAYLGTYFDGGVSAASDPRAWLGTANASASTEAPATLHFKDIGRTGTTGLPLSIGNAYLARISKDGISGIIKPTQAPTISAPAYAEGSMYYDTTLHKLRVGGAAGWETVTSS